MTLDAGTDAGVRDAGGDQDAGSDPDSGSDTDAGSDAGSDAGTMDSGMPDAGMSDAGMTDAGMSDAGPPDLCGNGVLDPGEMCDDGTTPGGCDDTCMRAPFCGDGTMQAGEVCDDGNVRSGDGCRSDCLSDETCGNGIVDSAAGEVCDSTTGCDPTLCAFVTGCGDGVISPPDVCDDSNQTRWDGCDSACVPEVALVVNSLAIAPAARGCDLDGDGSSGDNSFASNFGLFAVSFGQLLSMSVANGDLTLLLGFPGLDDRFGVNDADFGVAWLQGIDSDGNPANDYDGTEMFWVSSDSLDAAGTPLSMLESSFTARVLDGGPSDIVLPTGFFPLDLQAARVEGMSAADAASMNRLDNGLLCGGLPMSWLSLLGSLIGGSFERMPPCDGGAPATFMDLVIAGGTATVMSGGTPLSVPFPGATPDLDLDRDGLEGFTMTRGASCQAVVSSCTDGDGTVIPGRACYDDPRMGDGYSSAFAFTAVRAEFLGVMTP